MKALRFERFGSPSVLSVQEVDVPKPKPGDALIELRAAAINPSDVKNVAGAFHASLPRTPGRDYAGVVVEGESWKGREVWGSGAGLGVTKDGTHAQYLAVPIDWLSEKPAKLSMEEASSVGVPYLAAWSALIDAALLRAGETVLVTGARGAVGRAATQIAHWKNARVIGVDRSDGVSDADVFVNTSKKDLATEVKALTDGKGADVALDAVGGQMFEPVLKSLRAGGRQVAITSAVSRRVEFDLIDFYHNELRLIGVDTMQLTGSGIATIMDALRAGFESGHLKPYAITRWPLDKAVEAYTAVEKGDTRAKQVLISPR